MNHLLLCGTGTDFILSNIEGAIAANLTDINLKDLEYSHLDVEEGGRFAPRTCKPKYKVAIIIPYR